MEGGNWSWLEVAKLSVQALTPVLLIWLGWRIQRALKRLEHQQWRNQKLIEKRLQIYDSLAPLFNKLYCYFSFVGVWKELTPADVIKLKREIDQQVHLYTPLFSVDFYKASMALLNLCFEMYTGRGNDARLRTDYEHHRLGYKDKWQDEWENYFSADDIPSEREIELAYRKVIDSMVKEIRIAEK